MSGRIIKNELYIIKSYSGVRTYVECNSKTDLYETVAEFNAEGYAISSINRMCDNGTVPKVPVFTDPEYKKIRNYVDAKRVLSKWCYRVEDLGSCCSRVYYKDGTGDYTALTTCDDVHSGMVEIEGKVQNIYEWVKEGCI